MEPLPKALMRKSGVTLLNIDGAYPNNALAITIKGVIVQVLFQAGTVFQIKEDFGGWNGD
ncbi:hypothetical protein GS399_05140 [Pedobacter sp. HMF7647]|uniref:Uncharacterized protein n=1 Tax=Hufsiella arboris TaxID=2695275 RepID=A0A7K1Y8E1_9SPHI|nr:hypothetical protein [Hufsiella arboris]MXV50349.1 hypothetical protein [Hufsiella arboris]